MALQTGHAELKKAASDMANGNATLQNELRQIANIVDSIRGSWEGAAATAFQGLMERFSTDAKNLNDALMQISEATSGSADAYQAQEDDAAQSVSQITQALG